jgi:hypothetical protein
MPRPYSEKEGWGDLGREEGRLGVKIDGGGQGHRTQVYRIRRQGGVNSRRHTIQLEFLARCSLWLDVNSLIEFDRWGR